MANCGEMAYFKKYCNRENIISDPSSSEARIRDDAMRQDGDGVAGEG